MQINVRVPFEFREHLIDVAQERGVSVNHLVNSALETMYPIHRGTTSSYGNDTYSTFES